jgi:hypothetical protein
MLNRLTRILLALVTAFVFTGQMEAAAAHCARLAHEAAQSAVVATEAAPCHETAGATAVSHHQPAHHGNAADHPGPTHTPDHCQCVAALNGWTVFAGPQASAMVAPYAWLAPTAVQFASSEPDPDLRPPRA